MQPVWGMLSDRLGRVRGVRVMRLALLAGLVPGLLSALAPNLAVLILGRALAGALFAAVIPSALVYIGDAVPISGRQKALADQLAASAIATAIATAAAGLASFCPTGRRFGNLWPRPGPQAARTAQGGRGRGPSGARRLPPKATLGAPRRAARARGGRCHPWVFDLPGTLPRG